MVVFLRFYDLQISRYSCPELLYYSLLSFYYMMMECQVTKLILLPVIRFLRNLACWKDLIEAITMVVKSCFYERQVTFYLCLMFPILIDLYYFFGVTGVTQSHYVIQFSNGFSCNFMLHKSSDVSQYQEESIELLCNFCVTIFA